VDEDEDEEVVDHDDDDECKGASISSSAKGKLNKRVNSNPGNTLVVYRHYAPPRNKNGEVDAGAKRMNQLSESVLHKVLSMENVPSLLMAMNGEWIVPQEGRRIKLCNDVYLSITRAERSDWDVTALELTLFSRKKTATQMRRYLQQLHEEYVSSLNDELGSNIYLFDQKESVDHRGNPFESTENVAMQKKYDILNAPKYLSFQQLPFHSNKTFENLCGPEIDLISSRVNFFVNNRDWYDRKGVPYQLGLLLSGESGTGKSSCIRAITNCTGRHVVNVNFSKIKTVTQLKRLFYSEDLNVYRDEDSNESVKLTIPVNKRIYVLEEIDALGSTVLERRALNSLLGGESGKVSKLASGSGTHDEITLAHLLQIMDGNMETPGRILIVTSNHPELLDEAILRPGRIDVSVRFGFASRDTIAKMYAKLHDRSLSTYHVNALPDNVLSHADVMEVFLRNFDKEHKDNAVLEGLRERAESVVIERARRESASREHLIRLIANDRDEPDAPDAPDVRDEPDYLDGPQPMGGM
jgi:hypothetical protein